MKLTTEQSEKVRQQLLSFGALGPCPTCQHRQWTLSELIVEVREFHGAGLTLGGSLVPLIAINCTRCSNTQFFNAIFLGVVERQAAPPSAGVPS